MKAYVLNGVNDLRYENVEAVKPRDGWVSVKVKAAGICSSDIPRIYTKGTYHFPTICGHEFCGVVESVGNEGDSEWIGKSVGVFPLIPCKECDQCKKGSYETCANYDYLGSRRDGGFAEYVEVPVWNLIELDSRISFVEAAMLEPLSVALHAVKKANITKGCSFAVIGTGAIGFAAAQWAKALGAGKVCIIARNEDKRALADKLDGIEYISDNKDCYDVVLEAVGSNASICKAIEMTNAGGRLVLMGNPEGDINLPQNVFWRILRKQIEVVGTWNSHYESGQSCDWSEACEALAEGRINASLLISHTFDQENMVEGLELMRDKKEPYCKVMTIWNS